MAPAASNRKVRRPPRTSRPPRFYPSQGGGSGGAPPGKVKLLERRVLQALVVVLGGYALAFLFYLTTFGVALPLGRRDGIGYTDETVGGVGVPSIGTMGRAAAHPALKGGGGVPDDLPPYSAAATRTHQDHSIIGGRNSTPYNRVQVVPPNPLAIGTRVEVFWFDFDEYYPAKITKIKYVPGGSASVLRYTLLYDDGELVRGVDLVGEEKFRILDDGVALNATNPSLGGNDNDKIDTRTSADEGPGGGRSDVRFISNLTVGCSISVSWPDEEEYYPAEITGKKRGSNSTFRVRYDDGETGIVDLTREEFRIVGVRFKKADTPQRLAMLERAKMESDLVASGKAIDKVRQRSTGMACSALAAAAAARRQSGDHEDVSEAPKLRGKDNTDGNNTAHGEYKFRTETEHAPICSRNSLSPEDISYTLVSQVSDERLWMVTQHCKRWPGPMSIAVFTDSSTKHIRSILQDDAVAERGGCRDGQLDIQTLPMDGFTDSDYPINALRNMAMRSVRTTHAIYIDVDFWPSANLHRVLATPFVRDELSRDDKLAIVIPSFEYRPECHAERRCQRDERHISAMPPDKAGLVALIREEKAGVFDPTNIGGYLSTRYNLWFNMIAGDMMDIPCITSDRYEPFVVVRLCDFLPSYQESFTGYGKNKIVTIMQMRRIGYQFSQLGGAFLLHYPHERSRTREVWNIGWEVLKKRGRGSNENLEEGSDRTKYKFYQVNQIFKAFKAWMDDTLVDQPRVPICNNAADFR